MASILFLNDDCLYAIVSCLDDPSSFYSFALTCKRFLQVTKNARNVLHPSLLRTKAEYYIKCYAVNTVRGDVGKLFELIRVAGQFTAAKRILTYAKVVDHWQRNGPVAAKLFTWIRMSGKITFKQVIEFDSSIFTLHLPNCNKSMKIHSWYGTEFGHTGKIGIRVRCGNLHIEYASCPNININAPNYYLHWDEDKVDCAVEPMKPAIELLQKELGDTIPPITSHFFIWLCCFFPDQANLRGEGRLSFKEAVRNMKPNPGAVQSAMDLCRQEDEAKFQSVVSEWKNDDKQKSEYSKTLLETIELLVRRSEKLTI